MAGPTIDTAFVKQYEREVHEAYQRMGTKCRAGVRTKSNVKGSSTTFQKVGKGTATTKARHGEIAPMNLDHTAVECTLADYYAADYIDKLDELKVNHDERGVVTRAGAAALGRKTDDLIFTAANAGATSEGGSGLITLKRVLSALEILRENDVNFDNDVYGYITPHAEAELLNSVAQFTNADYVNTGQFENAYRARRWLDVNWLTHPGLPGVGTSGAVLLIWHKTAMGHAVGAEITSDITWQGTRAAHFVNNMMSQGSALIDANGVVKLPHNDTASLS